MRATMHDLKEAFDRLDSNYTVVRMEQNGRTYYKVTRNRAR